MRKKLVVIVVLILTVAFGYFQERVKVGTNFLLDMSSHIQGYDDMTAEQRAAKIDRWRYNAPGNYYFTHEAIPVLYALNRGELSNLKWVAGIFFALVHGVVTWLLLRLVFSDKQLNKIVLWVYGGALGASLLIFGLGRLLKTEMLYLLSREILGALQSLFPLGLLALSFYLYTRLKTD